MTSFETLLLVLSVGLYIVLARTFGATLFIEFLRDAEDHQSFSSETRSIERTDK